MHDLSVLHMVSSGSGLNTASSNQGHRGPRNWPEAGITALRHVSATASEASRRTLSVATARGSVGFASPAAGAPTKTPRMGELLARSPWADARETSPLRSSSGEADFEVVDYADNISEDCGSSIASDSTADDESKGSVLDDLGAQRGLSSAHSNRSGHPNLTISTDTADLVPAHTTTAPIGDTRYQFHLPSSVLAMPDSDGVFPVVSLPSETAPVMASISVPPDVLPVSTLITSPHPTDHLAALHTGSAKDPQTASIRQHLQASKEQISVSMSAQSSSTDSSGVMAQEQSVALLYDPNLDCFFDPTTQQYYQLKKS